jgi:hypothetical protein
LNPDPPGAGPTPETLQAARNSADKSLTAAAKEPGPGHEAALGELAALYAELERELAQHAPRCELSGRCCDFERFGHQLFATSLEVSYLRRSGPEPREPDAALCPYWVERRCTAREGRPLGCRVFFCDERYQQVMHEVAERYHGRVRRIIERAGLPYRYGPLVRLAREEAGGAEPRPT